jgi:cell division protein FtsZ
VPAPLAALLGAPVSVDGPGSDTGTAGLATLPDPPAAPPVPKTFDVAVTRRRPVVFEEDDDLDVPDFLK